MKRLAAAAILLICSCLPIDERFYPNQQAVNRFRTIEISTVDFYGGGLVEGIPVAVTAEDGSEEILENPTGTVSFRPKRPGVFSFRAGGGGRAVSVCENVRIPALFESVELYLPPSAQPGEPPRFSVIEYVSDDGIRNLLADSVLSCAPPTVFVSAVGTVPIDSSAAFAPDSPVSGAVDAVPNFYSRLENVSYPEIGIPENGFYRTSAEFDLSLIEWEEGLHFFALQCFDIYGNNTLYYVPFSVAQQPEDESLSGLRPEWIAAEGRTFSRARQQVAVSSDKDKTRYVSLDFRISRNKAEPAAVRGFLIYRSEAGHAFECIEKINCNGLFDSESYSYLDGDARLEYETEYRYKIRAFANGTLSRYSHPVSVTLDRPFEFEMTAPNEGDEVPPSPPVSFRVVGSADRDLFSFYDSFSFSINIGEVGVHLYEDPLWTFDVVYDCAEKRFFHANGVSYAENAFEIFRETVTADLSHFSKRLLEPGVAYWIYIGNTDSVHGPCFKRSDGVSSSAVFGSSAEWGGIMTDSLRIFSVERSG